MTISEYLREIDFDVKLSFMGFTVTMKITLMKLSNNKIVRANSYFFVGKFLTLTFSIFIQ